MAFYGLSGPVARGTLSLAALMWIVACGGAESPAPEEPQASEAAEAPAAEAPEVEAEAAAGAPPRVEAGAPAQADAPVVETRAGAVRGERESGVLVFRGIPYGEDTGGANRFKPVGARAAWQGVRDATEFGAICPQRGDVARGAPETGPVGFIPELPVSEDCLVLNVWTPAADDAARPVMVWYHGRGFREGAGSESWYDGSELAESGDVVVVTVNHRLNVFGYLHLAELGGEAYAGSGNAGMLDAVLALEWVRDNAAAFGGDPERVTIFGESGGGAKVSTLLAMPAAEGLFHGAIIQSGPGLRGTPAEQATETARKLLAELEIEPADIAKLQEMPIDRVLDAVEAVAAEVEGGERALALRPVVDGEALPAHPFDPVAAPTSAGVPILIGANKDEAALFLAQDPQRGTLTEEQLVERVQPALGENTEKVLQRYRETRPEASPWDLLIAVSTERTRLASLLIAERVNAISDAPVYVYSFDWESNYGDLKAAHAMEIPFVFNHPERVPLTGSGPGQEALAEVMSQAWVAFARSGDPAHPGLPDWQPYTAENRATLVFANEPELVIDLREEERAIWEGIGPRRL